MYVVHYLIVLVYLPNFLQVTEVYNYSQDDLLTEDMLVLDTHAEVFLWIGQSVDSKDKQKAFDIGQVSAATFPFIFPDSVFCCNNIIY